MFRLLRFSAKPKTLAAMAGLSVAAVALHAVLERLFPGHGQEVLEAGGAVAAGFVASHVRNIKDFATHLFTDFCAVAASAHAIEFATEERAREAEPYGQFNSDIQLAFGRILGAVVRGWGEQQPPMVARLAEAIAVTAEGKTPDHQPGWYAAAESVHVEIREDTLRDLCLNHGALPTGTRFLQETEWTAFLKKLAGATKEYTALSSYVTFWKALGEHLESHFPMRFYVGMKDAFADERHKSAWAALQCRIDAYIAAQASDAAAAARDAKCQTVLMKDAVERLTLKLADDMNHLMGKLDDQDRASLMPLLQIVEHYARTAAEKGERVVALLEGPTFANRIAGAIAESLKDAQSRPLTSGIYRWRREDRAPTHVERGDVLFGRDAQVIHLQRGYFCRLDLVQRQALSAATHWIQTLDTRSAPVTNLPTFWICGPSGAGKSILLLFLLADLHDLGYDVLWLGRNSCLLPAAMRDGRSLATARRVIVAVDDPYVPRSDRQVWEQARAEVADLLTTGQVSFVPLIVCCGPTEHYKRFQREVSDLVDEEPTATFSIPHLSHNDSEVLLRWFAARTGIGQAGPTWRGAGTLPILLLWKRSLGRPEELMPFLKLRISRWLGPPGFSSSLRDFFQSALALNRMYVDIPAARLDALTEDTKRQVRDLLDDLNLLKDDDEAGDIMEPDARRPLRLVHAQIAQVLYETWREHERWSDEKVADDVVRVINEALDLPDHDERIAPLRGFAACLETNRGAVRFSAATIGRIIMLAWRQWREHLSNHSQDQAAGLETWMSIFSHAGEPVSVELSPHPALIAAEYLASAMKWGEGVHSVGEALCCFVGRQPGMSRVLGQVAAVLKSAIDRQLSILADSLPPEEWFARWRLGVELERAACVHGTSASRFPATARCWLLSHGSSEAAQPIWERTLAIGLLGVPETERRQLSHLLQLWMEAHTTHDRWLAVWTHASRRAGSLHGCALERLFADRAQAVLTGVPLRKAVAHFRLCCSAIRSRDGKMYLRDPDAIRDFVRLGLDLVRDTPTIEAQDIITVVTSIWSLDSSLETLGDAERRLAHAACMAALRVLEERERSPLWKLAWFRALDFVPISDYGLRQDLLEQGLARLRLGTDHPDWPYVAKTLFAESPQLSDEEARFLFGEATSWLRRPEPHPLWNYVLREVIKGSRVFRVEAAARDALMRQGLERVRSYPNAPDFSFVWQLLREHIRQSWGWRALEANGCRELIECGEAWVLDRLNRSRPGWIHVLEGVIEEYTANLCYNSRDDVVRFELRPRLIDQAIRYIRQTGQQPGNAGVVALLFRSGIPFGELIALVPWLERYVFSGQPEEAWTVVQAVACRPDDLPAPLASRVLPWLQRWLQSATNEVVATWRATWIVAMNFAAGQPRGTHQTEVLALGIQRLEKAREFESTIAARLLDRWHSLDIRERARLDACLERVWRSLPQWRDDDGWLPRWRSLWWRNQFEPAHRSFDTEKLQIEARQWMGIGISVGFKGLASVVEALAVSQPCTAESLAHQSVTALRLVDEKHAAGAWSRVAQVLAKHLKGTALDNMAQSGLALLEQLKWGDDIIRVFATLWSMREQCPALKEERWLVAQFIRCGLEQLPRRQVPLIEGFLDVLDHDPPVATASDCSASAVGDFILRQLETSQPSLQMRLLKLLLRGFDRLIEPSRRVAALFHAKQVLDRNPADIGWNIVAVLAFDAARALRASGGAAAAEGEVVVRELWQTLSEGVLSAESGGGSEWWRLFRVVGRSAAEADDVAFIRQLRDRAKAELDARVPNPSHWADVWHEWMSLGAPIVEGAELQWLTEQGRQWLMHHPYHLRWPLVYYQVVEHREHLRSANDLCELGLARIRACAPHNVMWPPLWAALRLFGHSDELAHLGRSRVLLAPLGMPRLGNVLASLLQDSPGDGMLLDRADEYLSEIDHSRRSYQELEATVKKIKEARQTAFSISPTVAASGGPPGLTQC